MKNLPGFYYKACIERLKNAARLTSVSVVAVSTLAASPVDAQVIPDATLGAENSVVTGDVIRGGVSDRISGGARRDINLFHSFSQFDVPALRGAYFENPAGVQNIFSRVTGSDRSEILGRLGVLGSANLFFLSPNGILFGPAASLDVGGSFVATTANAIRFGDRGNFSATNPAVVDSILTIDPSAFLFNQATPASIVYSSSALNGTPSPVFGLQVPSNQSLILIGGEVLIDNGRLSSSGSRIELGGLATPGTINLDFRDSEISTSTPDGSSLANVSLINGTLIDTSGLRGGAISITGNRVTLDNGSGISSITFGNQDGRGISIRALHLEISNSSAISTASLSPDLSNIPLGSGSSIQIKTGTLNVRNSSLVSTISAFSFGNAGDIHIEATDEVVLLTLPTDPVASSIASLSVGFGSIPSLGSPGNITINTRDFRVQNSGILTTTFLGQSRVRDLTISATNVIELQTSFLRTNSIGGGAGGNISLKAPVILIRNGSVVSTSNIDPRSLGFDTLDPSLYTPQFFAFVQQLFSDPNNLVNAGQGNSGDISVNATKLLEITGVSPTNLFSSIDTRTNGAGQAGAVTIETNQLNIRDGAFISTSTRASGQAGSIFVTADSIRLNGVSVLPRSSTSITSQAEGETGSAGDITVNTRLLTISDGAFISTGTFGNGRGGDLNVIIRESGKFEGSALLINGQGQPSGLFTATSGSGRAGDLRLKAGQLDVIDGASISAQSAGQGQAGNLTVDVSRRLELVDSSITTQAPFSSGGNIQINTSPSFTSGIALLRSGDIRTNSLQDGGNITVGGTGLIAFRDSDIVASSDNAAGGSITFTTPAVFLEAFNRSTIQQGINRSTTEDISNGNNRVEVISTGRTQGGTVNLPDVSFIENSLSELQQTAIDPDTLIANSCIARTEQGGTFLVTGAEGLRDRPGDPFTSSYSLGTVRPLPAASAQTWQLGDPIVEPQGAYQLPSGRIVMSRECSK
ncbi:MAG: filamentous hemagglutinin N-terminal domain-containing protein [Leptolyngbya sp. UWPOB_LEPTO1]|uniref:two-partner secretion domain-containing protein n=1 Tax=Leptolyngbya sp. UWPOB_LEPTO1 TaxID=2815653 RepID=UPI001AD297A2|nr:filamentous hemagglutinin N-terminal domain-containing protein [Leptolyngbya sp. UWPOB_LEPTO1]MBN8564228.1 filamentous hemagglutinin N-terminal domain-containing protein [Leptolyngbya sp. UWPOB_LEPTO1]